MFARGRPCLRRRGLSAILDTVAAGPEEPLLFLYPRWFSSTVRQYRPISSERPIRPTRRLSFGARCCARRWGSSAAIEPKVERTGAEDRRSSSKTDVRESQDEAGSRTKSEKYQAAGARRRERSSPMTDKTGSESESADGRQRPYSLLSDIETVTSQSPLSQNTKGTSSTEKRNANTHTRPLAVPVRPREKTVLMMRRLSVRDRRKLRCRLFLSKNDKGRKSKPAWAEWDEIKNLLERLQQDARQWSKKDTKYKELLVPEETVALIAGITDMAMKENVWYVPVHNGCRVHVLHPRESEGQNRKVILSGSERVVELVVDRINQAQKLQASGDPLVDIRKPVVPVFPSMDAMKRRGLPVPLVRGVWDFYQARGRPMRLDEIKNDRQEFSTVRELAEFIEDLTRSQPSAPHSKTDGEPQVPHQTQVAKALTALFLNGTNQELLSTAALNRALTFLCEHEFLKSARAVFLRAEHVATVDTYNILLKSAARRQDITTFRRFLHAMHRAHVRPNSYTWLSFLDCLISPKAKSNLISHMTQNGYLSETSAVRTALQLTIQDSFVSHLESGKSVDSFINMILATSNWFPSSLLNQMFSVAVRMKDFDTINRLLTVCEQQNLNINSSTIQQILLLFRTDIFSALRYVYRCINRPFFQLEKETWERLFLIAFKGRHYNISRVIWRYACMNGTVTYKMKQSVLTSLIRNIPKKKRDDFDNIWSTSAGNIIVGIDLHHAHFPIQPALLQDIPPEFRKNPVLFLSGGFKPDGPERRKQRRVAAALTHRDIEIGARYKPARPLSIMLESAARVDEEWKGVPRPFPWMMQNAIQVPVKRVEYR